MKHWYHFFIIFAISRLSAFDAGAQSWSQTMANVYHTVKKESYFPVQVNPAMIRALDAFAHEADEHASFLGPDDYKQLLTTTSGNFFGIGVELAPKKEDDEYAVVLNVKPSSPAEKEGLKRYDKIVAIDGTPVGTLSTTECINKLKGDKRYSAVTLDIIREKTGALKFIIQRDSIPEENCWCYYMPQQKILYCGLSLFTQQVPAQLEAALAKGLLKKPKGIILDLRDNAGGVLKSAVDCASCFLANRSLVVSTKGRNNRTIDQYFTQKEPLVRTDIPVIILVNNYTASSAEILAQALKIHSKKGRLVGRSIRAPQSTAHQLSPHIFILGTPTYGKGSVQEVKPVGNNCALKITTALYYLPDNTSIQEKGIMPDFVIKQKYPQSAELKLLEKMYGKEQKHHKKEQTPHKLPKRNHKDAHSQRMHALKKDYQVECACNLLLLLDLARSTVPQEVVTHEKAFHWLHDHFACPRSMIAQEI